MKLSKNLDQSMAGEGAMWSASVRQSFEWTGRLGLRKAIANQDVALATLGLEAFRRDLSGKVRENAFGLASAEEKSRVASLVADRFRALREVLVHRDPAGIAPQLEVRIDAAPRTGAATQNAEETVLGTVMMLMGENSRIVAHRVGLRIAELQARLPRGIEVQVVYDRSNLVDRTVATVKRNLSEGAVLVVVVLLLLLGNVRAALIVACAIPLSCLCAMIGMARFGISGNLMSLGAVDFGLIIDGAVVIVENIVCQLAHRQHQSGRVLTVEERHRTVLAAAREVGSPVFLGVLIITIVYLPILSLTGVEGKMFRPMALTVMLALGGALALAMTLMPVLASFFWRLGERNGKRPHALAPACVLAGAGGGHLRPRLGGSALLRRSDSSP